jgi:hypothetical protein
VPQGPLHGPAAATLRFLDHHLHLALELNRQLAVIR